MKEQEKELFFELCKFKNVNVEKISLLLKHNSTPHVLGQLFSNRMSAVAYGVLKNNKLLSKTNREFRNSLEGAYRYNTEVNYDYYHAVEFLGKILSEHQDKYAMLKGASLCRRYPDGYRTSNDVDLLVHPKNIAVIGNLLSDNGFEQGYIRNGEFVPATRQEIIESRVLRGETVPYVLEIDLPYLRYLEVDINFSLDYKNSNNDLVESMLKKIVKEKIRDTTISVLNHYDFFIHLCCHLYKEATTLPWIKMRRDMTLYKYVDIYMLLQDYGKNNATVLFNRADELGLKDICACVIIWANELFDNIDSYIHHIAVECLENRDILYTVVDPAGKRILTYPEKNIKDRFFSENRMELLKEV